MLIDGLNLVEGSENTNLVVTNVTEAQRAALTNVNAGEVVFVTDGSAPGLYTYDGAAWVPAKDDLSALATKTEVTTALALKADATALTSGLALKANAATTYSKTEVDTALALKATPAQVTTAIQAVVGAAPAALDTLAEIATQLAADETAAAALTTAVSLRAPINSPTFTGSVSGITAAMVGLGNVNNTADSAKPVSTAQQTALDAKVGLTTVNTVTGRVQDSDGNLRSVPQSNKTSAYTLEAADNGKNINITTGGVTLSALAAGDIVSIYNKSGTAQNISWSGLTVYLAGTSTAKTSPLSLSARGVFTAMYVSASEVVVSGNV